VKERKNWVRSGTVRNGKKPNGSTVEMERATRYASQERGRLDSNVKKSTGGALGSRRKKPVGKVHQSVEREKPLPSTSSWPGLISTCIPTSSLNHKELVGSGEDRKKGGKKHERNLPSMKMDCLAG